MIDLFRPYLNHRARANAVKVMTPDQDTGRLYIGQGKVVEHFEGRLAETLQVAPEDVVTVNSGTSALDLAMHIAGVGPGKPVIATPMTCSATVTPAATKWGQVIWADIDPVTGLITPESVEDRIKWCLRHLGRPPAAILAVDWGGRVCDYDAIRKAAQIDFMGASYSVPIIQDAAHSFLATDAQGRPVAQSAADFRCFSFQAIKHLTTIDGGALICRDRQNSDRARLLRWYGLDRTSGESFRCSQDIQEPGFKYHMNDVNAAVGLGNLEQVADIVGKHRQNALWYSGAFKSLSGAVQVPPHDEGSSCWLYTLLVDDRDGFIAHLRAAEIEASPVHRRCDAHPGFTRHTYGHMPLPGVNQFAAREVAIPVGWWLKYGEVERVAAAVFEWAGKQDRQAPVA